MKDWTPKEIKMLREKHSLPRHVMGSLLGVTGNYIYMLEKGVRKPGKSLKLLLDYLEKQLEEEGKERKKHGKGHL